MKEDELFSFCKSLKKPPKHYCSLFSPFILLNFTKGMLVLQLCNPQRYGEVRLNQFVRAIGDLARKTRQKKERETQ